MNKTEIAKSVKEAREACTEAWALGMEPLACLLSGAIDTDVPMSLKVTYIGIAIEVAGFDPQKIAELMSQVSSLTNDKETLEVATYAALMVITQNFVQSAIKASTDLADSLGFSLKMSVTASDEEPDAVPDGVILH